MSRSLLHGVTRSTACHQGGMTPPGVRGGVQVLDTRTKGLAEIRSTTPGEAWPRSVRGRDRVVEQQARNEALEAFEGFIGVARGIL